MDNVSPNMEILSFGASCGSTAISDQAALDALGLCGGAGGDGRIRPTVQASATRTYSKPNLDSEGCVAGELLFRHSGFLLAGSERIDVEITCIKDVEADDDDDYEFLDADHNTGSVVNGVAVRGYSRVCFDAIDPTVCQADAGQDALYSNGYRESLSNMPMVRFSFVRCDDAADSGATPCVGRGAGVAVTVDEIWMFAVDVDGSESTGPFSGGGGDSIILTNPSYGLGHVDRSYDRASANNYCACESDALWNNLDGTDVRYVTKELRPPGRDRLPRLQHVVRGRCRPARHDPSASRLPGRDRGGHCGESSVLRQRTRSLWTNSL